MKPKGLVERSRHSVDLGFGGLVCVLLAPLGVVIAAIPLVPPRGVEPLVPLIAPFAFVIAFFGFCGFVPYILVAVVISIWSWGKPRSSLNRVILLWPLLVAAAGDLWFVVLSLYLIGPPPSGDEVTFDLSTLALLFFLVAGALYVYLLTALALHALIRRAVRLRAG